MKKTIITVVGKDTVGIIAKVCVYLAENNINILDISQTIVQGYFNMMMIVDRTESKKHFKETAEELEKLGELIIYDETYKSDIGERIKDADVIFINKAVIGKEEMDAAPNLKYVGIMATGTNNVDLDYAAGKGITVTNVKGYSTTIVAQHTFALLFSVMEHIQYYDNYVKSGELP